MTHFCNFVLKFWKCLCAIIEELIYPGETCVNYLQQTFRSALKCLEDHISLDLSPRALTSRPHWVHERQYTYTP